MELAQRKWFTSWFDSPYYHILYKDRDQREAEIFMRHLIDFLKLPKGSSILDLACGKGRHSVFLNELGYDVTGVDLSENSITYARQFQNERLEFHTHCMCTPFANGYDAVFNLFTSFGYFEREEDNQKSISAIKQALKPGGYGVIDFMNTWKVLKNLVPEEDKQVGDILFRIRRYTDFGYIFKKITFEDQGEEYEFTEKVKALELEDFLEYFEQAGITLHHTFGNYELKPFDEKHSDRLILVFT